MAISQQATTAVVEITAVWYLSGAVLHPQTIAASTGIQAEMSTASASSLF